MKKEKSEQVEDIKNFACFKNNNSDEFASSKTSPRYVCKIKMMRGFR